MRHYLLALASILLFGGCAKEVSLGKKEVVTKQNLPRGEYKPRSGFYYTVVKKLQDGSFKVEFIDDLPIPNILNPNDEILRVSEDLRLIEPYFSQSLEAFIPNRFECKIGENVGKYNQCTSDFTKIRSSVLGVQNVGYIDYEMIYDVANRIDLVGKIEEFKAQKLKEQQSAIDEALAEDASKSAQKEHKEHKEQMEYLKQKEQNQSATTQAEMIENSKMAKHKRELESFRSSLKVGSETNCGKVLLINAQEIKVSYKSTTLKIAKDKIFPKEYECIVVGGIYKAPPSF